MRKTRRNMAALVWVATLLLSCSAMASGLQAWLDRAQTGEGQSVVLYLAAPADTFGEPELSALRKDFDIVNITQGQHMQAMSGYPGNMRTWQLTLAPKRPGRLTVPALRVGQASSTPLALDVYPAGQVMANRALRDVMLQTDVSPQRPYVQGKVIYTVRLYTRLDLRKVHFSEPEVLGAMVERLGEDRKYNTRVGRYRYHVLQRRFVLFPQRSGLLSVVSPLLNAEVREEKRPDWPLQLRGPEIVIDVQPQPDASMDPWLPAESLQLSENWSPDPPSFRVGEPVKRNITITAQGVAAAQLPDLMPSPPQDINLYPERPSITSHAVYDTLVTRKVLSYALVASREGNYRLPEISLSWWDTTTGQRKTERLAARDIVVLPGAAPAKEEAQPTRDVADYLSGVDLAAWWQTLRDTLKAGMAIWPWLALLLVLVVLTTMLIRWLARRSRSKPLPPKAAPTAQPAGEAWRRFESACKQQDPHAAREALIDWAAATWPNDPPERLDRLAQRLPPQAADYLAGIDRALYAPTGEVWDGPAVLEALRSLLQQAARDQTGKQDTQALPPLYPG